MPVLTRLLALSPQGHVLILCDCLQVVRAYTAVVAALVVNDQPFRYWPVLCCVTVAVGEESEYLAVLTPTDSGVLVGDDSYHVLPVFPTAVGHEGNGGEYTEGDVVTDDDGLGSHTVTLPDIFLRNLHGRYFFLQSPPLLRTVLIIILI